MPSESDDRYLWLKTLLGWLDEKLGLPVSFIEKMVEEGDWLFVIKWHAVLEACVNHVLTTHFKKPAASKVFERLDMSDQNRGKMAFVSACDLLPKDMVIFIQRLSAMRNYAVHDIKNFTFTFSDYRENAIKPEERSAWNRQIAFSIRKAENPKDREWEKIVEELPRLVINMGCLTIAAAISGYCMKEERLEESLNFFQRKPYQFPMPSIEPKNEESNPKE